MKHIEFVITDKNLLIVRDFMCGAGHFKYKVSIENAWGRKLAVHKCIPQNW